MTTTPTAGTRMSADRDDGVDQMASRSGLQARMHMKKYQSQSQKKSPGATGLSPIVNGFCIIDGDSRPNMGWKKETVVFCAISHSNSKR